MESEARLENFMTRVMSDNTLFQSNISVNVFKVEIV